MSWLASEAWQRPVVWVEDHLYHIGALLGLLEREAPGALRLLTVACLDRPGPDTGRAVAGWLERYPGLRVAACVEPSGLASAIRRRIKALPAGVFDHHALYVRAVAGLLRPGGLLLQDVQLETLAFVPRGRWWESILLASTVRGMFADRPPTCRFLSNKKGYEVTFGRDLLDAGFDPRDVLDKNDLGKVVVPALRAFFEGSMPWRLRVIERGEATLETAASAAEAERAEIEAELDLVLWELADGIEVGGRTVESGGKNRLVHKPGNPAGETWRSLIADLFAAGSGVPVLDVGSRVAPELAGRAEAINYASRHLHQLRSRLRDRAAIQNVDRAYRLSDRLKAAWVTEESLLG